MDLNMLSIFGGNSGRVSALGTVPGIAIPGTLMVNKPKRAALYLPVSTDGQTAANQSRALKAVAAQRGWTIVATYDDNGKHALVRDHEGSDLLLCGSQCVLRIPHPSLTLD